MLTIAYPLMTTYSYDSPLEMYRCKRSTLLFVVLCQFVIICSVDISKEDKIMSESQKVTEINCQKVQKVQKLTVRTL